MLVTHRPDPHANHVLLGRSTAELAHLDAGPLCSSDRFDERLVVVVWVIRRARRETQRAELRLDLLHTIIRCDLHEVRVETFEECVPAGVDVEEVAYRSGLTRYTYQKYEKGESRPGNPANPTLRTLIAMAQVLAVSVEELIPDAPPDLRAR